MLANKLPNLGRPAAGDSFPGHRQLYLQLRESRSTCSLLFAQKRAIDWIVNIFNRRYHYQLLDFDCTVSLITADIKFSLSPAGLAIMQYHLLWRLLSSARIFFTLISHKLGLFRMRVIGSVLFVVAAQVFFVFVSREARDNLASSFG